MLRLTYRGDGAESPVLSAATRDLGVSFNILHGRIEYIVGKPMGVLVVCVDAPREELHGVIEYLTRRGVELTVLREPGSPVAAAGPR